MRNQFDKQMDELNTQLIRMGAMCEETIAGVTKSLFEGNVVLAREKKEHAREIDQLERDIEQLCMKLLLHQQPVAGDLRQISAALRMITNMERIGDQAEDIAELVILLNGSQIKEAELIDDMALATVKMVTDSVDAFVRKDIALAENVILEDDIVDDFFDRMKNTVVELIIKQYVDAESALDFFMIAKYLERIGDHAVNIAEWIIYAMTGKHKEGGK
ncbi:phosphate signaling complex protein PhoU [Amygdalobacter nucleatus]|uniref:Phosphate-specific transport system accessory protein PhoU n=1 Tax=Amygdalobacter nucleatus TaxID=3029274 RepID=A0A133YC22_9FIRM|nr:phosphate signaling complex protein PhoU [Amygdalobacter nucleatus]KXB40743.1 phosphate transport system regulatory protein PhoU [Amygdalobacter nucleatus]MDF0485139.1 phosphate signaling complex protein PhoU [Amygdalobacter nucleatus]